MLLLSVLLAAAPLPFIKAVSYDPSYPGKELFDEIPPQVIEEDFAAIKRAGFNAVRSYEPFNDTLLDLAEKHSLYVIEGLVRIDDGTDFRSKEALEQVKHAAVSVVERHKKRKAILLWSLWNDAPFQWGTQGGNVARRFGADVVNRFLGELSRAVKAADPSRLVTAANVLNAPGYDVGFEALDVIGLNVYVGITDWASGSFDASLGRATVDRIVEISKKYHKPVYISELGQSDYGRAASQAEVIPTQLRLLGKRVAGFCLFQWQDQWSKAGNVMEQANDIETHWGLVDAYRKPKAGFSAVSAAVARAPVEDTVIESFDFANNQALLATYGIRNKGASHFRATVQDKHLAIEFVPDDFGAWLYFGRDLATDWAGYRELRFVMKSVGPVVNVSPFLITADGKVLRGAAFLTKSAEWEEHRVDLSTLFRDHPFERSLGTRKITGVGFKINDVANFEQIGVTTTVHIDEVAFSR